MTNILCIKKIFYYFLHSRFSYVHLNVSSPYVFLYGFNMGALHVVCLLKDILGFLSPFFTVLWNQSVRNTHIYVINVHFSVNNLLSLHKDFVMLTKKSEVFLHSNSPTQYCIYRYLYIVHVLQHTAVMHTNFFFLAHL